MTTSNDSFVHLHVHSEFSLLDGMSRIKDLVSRAKELKMPAVALTDHGSMIGTIPFYRTAKAAGVRPIIGIETYVSPRGMTDRDPVVDRKPFHLLLLAKDQLGFKNLLKIASASQLQGFYHRPRVDHDFLEAHSEGLIATSGCLAGEVPRALVQGDDGKANQLLSWYRDVFGKENFFIELQRHEIPELDKVNPLLLEMANRYDLRTVATNDVHYTYASEATAHDVLLCIQTGQTLETERRLRMSDAGYYLKSAAEMSTLFSDVPQSLSNSLLIAEMCDVKPYEEGYHLPLFEVPAGYEDHSYLRELCETGLKRRFGEDAVANDPKLRERLEYELGIIHTMGFDSYFLIVWDLCEFARREDIWWNVRGSGAGSLVAFALAITNLNPLEHGLFFERFLNPDRVSMPDIDLDYPDNRRQELIDYTIRRYGSDKVAQIITFGTLGARAAIRDVGRVLNVGLNDVDSIARMIPLATGKALTIESVLTPNSGFHSRELVERYESDPIARNLIDTAKQLEGIARHASTHAAGVIIADKPLDSYVPLHRPTRSNGEEAIGALTQWPMEIVESIGLLKIDFLGLSTLSVLRKAADLVEQRHGVKYTINNIPYNVGQVGPDPEKRPEKLFELLGRGEVAGVFQVEGAGMRRLMMDMKPTRFEHVMAAISLYRPGPMENIGKYVDRMHGRQETEYKHPDLEPILGDTYGILVYQEQIIQIASTLSGYSPGEADLLRKAVAKKKKALMAKGKVKFISNAVERGYDQNLVEQIWGDIEYFAHYGFNKAHAADYALITGQTAFLKAHYPVEYMTALLSVERDKPEKISNYLAEARRMGIAVSAPDIRSAHLDFTIEDTDDQAVIRYGLGAIKNVGAASVQILMDEREAGGPFADFNDLCTRVSLREVGKRAMESMAKVGVFDAWADRARVIDGLERVIGHSTTVRGAADAGQMNLFGGEQIESFAAISLLPPESAVSPLSKKQMLSWEKELVGAYLSEHPVTRYLDDFGERATATTATLDESLGGSKVSVLGLITDLRHHTTKKGAQMAFAKLEDLHGQVEIVFFPHTWKRLRSRVAPESVAFIRGELRVDGKDRVKILVDDIADNFSIGRPDKIEGQSAEARLVDLQPVPQLAPTRGDDSSRRKRAIESEAAGSTGGSNARSGDSRRSVAINVVPSDEWQKICRTVIRVAKRYRGTDELKVVLTGQQVELDFPNVNTRLCPELMEELSALSGVEIQESS